MKKKSGRSSAILWERIMGRSGTAMPTGLTALCVNPVSWSFTSSGASLMLNFLVAIWQVCEKRGRE